MVCTQNLKLPDPFFKNLSPLSLVPTGPKFPYCLTSCCLLSQHHGMLWNDMQPLLLLLSCPEVFKHCSQLFSALLPEARRCAICNQLLLLPPHFYLTAFLFALWPWLSILTTATHGSSACPSLCQARRHPCAAGMGWCLSLCHSPASVIHLMGSSTLLRYAEQGLAISWQSYLTFYLYEIVLLSKQAINQLLLEPGLRMVPE